MPDRLAGSSDLEESSRALIESFGSLLGEAADRAVEDLPVFGTLKGLYGGARHVQQMLFVTKLERMLTAYSRAIEPTKREKHSALREFGNVDDQKLGEALLLLLERTDNMEKPPIIGRVVADLVQGRLKYDVAMSLCGSLDRVLFEDIEVLKDTEGSGKLDVDDATGALQRLHAQGLCKVVEENWEGHADEEIAHQVFGVSPLGHELLKRLG